MTRMSETQVAEDEIAARGMENHCSVLILDRFEAGSRGIRDLLLYSRELSLSHFRRNGRIKGMSSSWISALRGNVVISLYPR